MDSDFEDSLKRKSKSPSLARDHEPKRVKVEHDEADSTEDIAKQYKKFVAAPKFNLNSEELYCVCRKPDIAGDMMISCDGCEEWFHVKCMKIDTRAVPLLDKFFCRFCQWRGIGQTRWNRKCREPSCYRPILKLENSKYCSPECGQNFLRNQLVGSKKLSKGEISFVINYCTTFENLQNLGTQFPELPEVQALDTSKLPEKVVSQLEENDKKSQSVQQRLDSAELRSKYLLRVKELVKLVNERIQAQQDPSEEEANDKKSKKKKSKTKKIDLCCYPAKLTADLPSASYQIAVDAPDTHTAFKSEIDSAVEGYGEDESYSGDICLQDRRKCLRHNGWANLLTDQTWKQSIELKAVLEQLTKEKAAILRDYSISVYDNDVKEA